MFSYLPIRILLCKATRGHACKLGFVFGMVLAAAHYPAKAGESDDPIDALDAATKLFLYITKPVPNARIVANVQVHETAWTQEQIDRAIPRAKLEQDMQGETKERIEEVIKANVENLKRAHSGTSTIRLCEWVGPGVYRRDEVILDAVRATNSFKGGKGVKYTWVNVFDRGFSPIVSWRANPLSQVATVSRDPISYHVDNLWECMAIEPESAFAFMLLVKKRTYSPPAAERWLTQSFCSFRSGLDHERLRNLVEGRNTNWVFLAHRGTIDGIQCVIITLEARVEKGAGITYYMDWPLQKNMLRTIRKVPSKNVEVTVTRRGHDQRGVPREWVAQGRTEEGALFRKVDIIEAELDPPWDLKEVFSPNFPENFVVDEVSGGTAKNIQWPSGKPKPVFAASAVGKGTRLSSGTVIIAIVVVNCCLVVLFILARRGKHPSQHGSERA